MENVKRRRTVPLPCVPGERVVQGPAGTLSFEPSTDDYRVRQIFFSLAAKLTFFRGPWTFDCAPDVNGDFDVFCNCAGEIWVNEECDRAFVFSGPS